MPWNCAFETFEQQQDSCPSHAKRAPKKCFTSPLESIKKAQLPAPKCIGTPPSKKTQLPAPKCLGTAQQQQDSCPGHAIRAPKKCFTSPLESIKKTQLPAPKCIGTPPSKKTQLPAPKCLGTAPSKHSNSSRIRVQAMQNERRKSASRHLWNP